MTLARLMTIPCLLFCLLSACASSRPPAINKQKAIEIAIENCKSFHLVLASEPQNIRARVITLGEADQLTSVKGESRSYSQPLSTRVWFVQMDGQLLLEGGPVLTTDENGKIITPAPPQPFWGTCTAVFEADTGTFIFVHDIKND